VIAANDGPLEQAPKAFNRIHMERADHVLLGAMLNAAMVVGVPRWP
jgi:hypothetical protein